jgi:hypothetical protein
MKHIRRAIALSGLLVLLTFSAALGQSERQTVYIPFAFSVGEKAFAAGNYSIERTRKDSETAWIIRQKDTGEATVFLTRSVRANETPEQTRLVFHRYDDLYFLSEFWSTGNNGGRQVQITNRERAIEKALAEKRQDVILTGRGQ